MPEQMIPPDPEQDPRNQKKYQYEMTPVRAFLTPLGRRLLPLIAKVDVEGAENLPAEGPVILASNHVTNFDVLPIQPDHCTLIAVATTLCGSRRRPVTAPAGTLVTGHEHGQE